MCIYLFPDEVCSRAKLLLAQKKQTQNNENVVCSWEHVVPRWLVEMKELNLKRGGGERRTKPCVFYSDSVEEREEYNGYGQGFKHEEKPPPPKGARKPTLFAIIYLPSSPLVYNNWRVMSDDSFLKPLILVTYLSMLMPISRDWGGRRRASASPLLWDLVWRVARNDGQGRFGSIFFGSDRFGSFYIFWIDFPESNRSRLMMTSTTSSVLFDKFDVMMICKRGWVVPMRNTKMLRILSISYQKCCILLFAH